MMRSVLAAGFILLAGGAVLWAATDGGKAFTAEGARRLDVQRTPRAVPDVQLEDHEGRVVRLSDYRDKVVVVDFIYTRCATFCISMTSALQVLQAQLAPELEARELALLSVSFDSVRDTVPRLADYGMRFGARAPGWRLVRVSRPEELAPLLAAFGIVVVPDAYGGFEHNAALHVLEREGRLARILDYDDPQAAERVLREYL